MMDRGRRDDEEKTKRKNREKMVGRKITSGGITWGMKCAHEEDETKMLCTRKAGDGEFRYEVSTSQGVVWD